MQTPENDLALLDSSQVLTTNYKKKVISDIKIAVLLSLFRNPHFQREASRGGIGKPCCCCFSLLARLSVPFHHFIYGHLIPAAALGHLYLSHPSFYFGVQKLQCSTKKKKRKGLKTPPMVAEFPRRLDSKHVTLMMSKLRSA